MPSHETRALDLLLPFAPSDGGQESDGEAYHAALCGASALGLSADHRAAAHRRNQHKSQSGVADQGRLREVVGGLEQNERRAGNQATRLQQPVHEASDTKYCR